MPRQLDYPPPENLLVKHPVLGIGFWKNKKFYNADSGNEINTRQANVKKGWTLYPLTRETSMFYVFNVKSDQVDTKLGISANSEKDAVQRIRAKLGLDANATLQKVEEFVDCERCSFDEIKNATPKANGNDSDEHLKKGIESFQPEQGETDPSRTKLSPESESDGTPGQG